MDSFSHKFVHLQPGQPVSRIDQQMEKVIALLKRICFRLGLIFLVLAFWSCIVLILSSRFAS